MTTTTEPAVRAPQEPTRRPHTKSRKPSDWAALVVAVLIGLFIAFPFILILINSFKSPVEYANGGPLGLPDSLYFDGLTAFWERVNFPRVVWNSLVIAGTVAVCGVLLSMLNAFALGIGRVRARMSIVVVILLATMLPQEVLLYPLYFMFRAVGLYDNVWSVIITFTVVQSAFGTYLLSSLYSTFPRELLEAASIDGASRWRILWRVVYPISRPTLSVLLIFFFIWTWNEFLVPLTFLISTENQTVPVAITNLQGSRLMDVTTTSASALLGVIPTLIFFLIFQRTLTRGITAGAVK